MLGVLKEKRFIIPIIFLFIIIVVIFLINVFGIYHISNKSELDDKINYNLTSQQITPEIKSIPVLSCIDGTLENNCSKVKPKKCINVNGNLTFQNDCNLCGCENNLTCHYIGICYDPFDKSHYLFNSSDLLTAGFEFSKFENKVVPGLDLNEEAQITYNQEGLYYNLRIYYTPNKGAFLIYKSMNKLYLFFNFSIINRNEFGDESIRFDSGSLRSLEILKGNNRIGFLYNTKDEKKVNELARIGLSKLN